ncbi:hypothetical protein BBD39_04400 [Arsenophonus endosymbiont of Bemisia tabaci Asia II 3]|nr:hypothetical protein BBD39_04400 [Arsenophonus endosymbiont of Bemisia tabaci Asia II 3]
MYNNLQQLTVNNIYPNFFFKFTQQCFYWCFTIANLPPGNSQKPHICELAARWVIKISCFVFLIIPTAICNCFFFHKNNLITFEVYSKRADIFSALFLIVLATEL